uniref:Methyl-CpG-binding domain protein 2 n=1 Tax=Parascaris univalens TaxID=6257 RepID=A0A915C3V1_PARUN
MGRTKGSEAGNLSVTKRGSKGKDRSTVIAKSGFDGPMNAPWRKTVSIFKQPVTLVHTTSRETKNPTPEQLKRGAIGPKAKAEKPRQMFWAKALEGACAMVPMCSADRVMTDPNEHIAQRLNLAGKMEPALAVLGPDASAASLCSALHGFCSGAVTAAGAQGAGYAQKAAGGEEAFPLVKFGVEPLSSDPFLKLFAVSNA